jgi:hypothetical protein
MTMVNTSSNPRNYVVVCAILRHMRTPLCEILTHESECRANLFHVKQAWRDESMHAKQRYSEAQAHQILERTKDFMQHLSTL